MVDHTVATTQVAVIGSNNALATDADVPTNGGVQVDTNGIDAFGSGGDQTFDLNSATGRVTAGNTTTEKYIDFDPTTGECELGRDTKLRGTDAYNNDNIFFHSFFESIDSWAKSISSSAYAILNNLGLHLQVSGSSVEHSRITLYFSRPLVTPVWSKDQRFKTVVNSQNASGGVLYIVRGTVAGKRFGFKVDGTTLYGVSYNSGSETLVDLSTTVGSADLKIEAIFTSGVDIEFFVNNVSEGTISTNLPTGGALTGAEKTQIELTKSATLGTSDFFINEIKIIQEF